MSTTAHLFGRTVYGKKLWEQLKASNAGLSLALDWLPNADKAVVRAAPSRALVAVAELPQFPNPFRGTEPGLEDSKHADLWLIDGAYVLAVPSIFSPLTRRGARRTDENLPIWPLEHRHPDVVIAIEAVRASSSSQTHADPCQSTKGGQTDVSAVGRDSSSLLTETADARSFSLWYAMIRSRRLYKWTWEDRPTDYALIPKCVPSPLRHLSKTPPTGHRQPPFRGSEKQPWFVGCDEPKDTLLVVYLPNSYVVARTNHSGWKTSFTKQEVDDYFRNAFAIATQNEPRRKKGRGWAFCLSCIFVKRHAERKGRRLPSACAKCFEKYCYRRDYSRDEEA